MGEMSSVVRWLGSISDLPRVNWTLKHWTTLTQYRYGYSMLYLFRLNAYVYVYLRAYIKNRLRDSERDRHTSSWISSISLKKIHFLN